MKSLEECAQQSVAHCMGLKRGEKTVIIYDQEAYRIASAVFKVATDISPGMAKAYVMESYGERRDDDVNPLKFPDEIKNALQEADVSFFMASSKPGEYESFRRPLTDIVKARNKELNPKLRHAHMPGITEEVFRKGMSADYLKLREFTARIKSLVEGAKQIRVTTPRDTDFTVDLSSKYKWVISDGSISPERWGNLPGSEVFTCPKNLNGRIVADGTLGDFFDKKYGLLQNTPLYVCAKDGRVKGVNCLRNNALAKEFENYIQRDENANRFGEIGIGTNVNLKRIMGNMLHDEKIPGVHVAVGNPYPEETGADWDCKKIHCDMVMKDCNIFVDGEQIMLLGEFNQRLTRGIFS